MIIGSISSVLSGLITASAVSSPNKTEGDSVLAGGTSDGVDEVDDESTVEAEPEDDDEVDVDGGITGCQNAWFRVTTETSMLAFAGGSDD